MPTDKPPRTLQMWSIGVMILLAAVVIKLNQTHLPQGIDIDIEGQPTIGYSKAQVSVVAFEEPKCRNCKLYNNTVFPEIKRQFVDTNKIRYTVIPVSFLPNSMPAAVALLCAYHKDAEYPNDDLFFKFLDYMYLHQPPEFVDWATIEKLEEFAKAASPAISLKKLQSCVEHEGYRVQIVKNTEYAAKIMNGTVSTPTIFVNGVEVEENSVSGIRSMIVAALAEKGER